MTGERQPAFGKRNDGATPYAARALLVFRQTEVKAMHKHLCLDCDAIIDEGDFDCESDADHDFALCSACTAKADARRKKEEKR